jgi:hypothetical protein
MKGVYTALAMPQQFRELGAIQLWSTCVIVESEKSSFIELLHQVACEKTFTFFGFFLLNSLSETTLEYHFTRYPRQKHGIRSIEECKDVKDALFTLMDQGDRSTYFEEENVNHIAPFEYRVILGLLEGYDKDNVQHSLQEVKANLGDKYGVKPAEIYSVGPDYKHTEPAVAVYGGWRSLSKVYQVAEKLGQERFTVENFLGQYSYVVETPRVRHPDK